MVLGRNSNITVSHISIGNSQILPVSHARNLGFILDSAMTLYLQHYSLCTLSHTVRNIGKIRKYMYLDHDSTVQIHSFIHSFITSRIDTCNSLIYGSQDQLNHIQWIQNIAAHVVTLLNKLCHITPILKELHWLPVSHRIISQTNADCLQVSSELLNTYTPFTELTLKYKIASYWNKI